MVSCVFLIRLFYFKSIKSCVPEGNTAGDQSIPIILTQQELAALVQQQQQLHDVQNQQEPEHSGIPTGTPAASGALVCL